MIQPAGGRKKITVFYYNSFRKSRYLVQKTLVSVDGMGDSDGDDGSSFGSIETVTDSEQEANAAALLTAAARDLSWTFFAGGDFTWFAKATRGSRNSPAGGRETTFCRSLIFQCSSSIADGKREKTKRRWRWGRCGLRLVSPKTRCRPHTVRQEKT